MIIVIDFGGQTCHLIARRVRELGVSVKIISNTFIMRSLHENVEGIILSGGPSFVNLPDSPTVDKKIFELGIPVLGICRGMQFLNVFFGGCLSRGVTDKRGLCHPKRHDPVDPHNRG